MPKTKRALPSCTHRQAGFACPCHGELPNFTGDAVKLDHVSFSYLPHVPFIEDLSLSFQTGAVTSIIGPNGCGKSTLVKLIDGLLRPSSGQVLLNGALTLCLTTKERARLVAVLSQTNRIPPMSVEDLVECGRFPYQGIRSKLGPSDRELVDWAINRTGIDSMRNADLKHLSGGERQRAFIAMTLAQDTDIIVFDEPTTYLDIQASHHLMELIQQLNRETGKTFIMVIHDLELALRYSDRLCVMEHGMVLATGKTSEILQMHCIQRAFGVSIERVETDHGPAFTFFADSRTEPAQR